MRKASVEFGPVLRNAFCLVLYLDMFVGLLHCTGTASFDIVILFVEFKRLFFFVVEGFGYKEGKGKAKAA